MWRGRVSRGKVRSDHALHGLGRRHRRVAGRRGGEARHHLAGRGRRAAGAVGLAARLVPAPPRGLPADYPRRRRGVVATRLHGISRSWPRRRRDPSPWNIQVVAAASSRSVASEYPGRGRGVAAIRRQNICAAKARAALEVLSHDVLDEDGLLVPATRGGLDRVAAAASRPNVHVAAAASSPRNIHVAAAAPPRFIRELSARRKNAEQLEHQKSAQYALPHCTSRPCFTSSDWRVFIVRHGTICTRPATDWQPRPWSSDWVMDCRHEYAQYA